MAALHVVITVFCGLLIGLALLLLIRSLRRMLRGKCCEGCDGCPQTDNCSSYDHKKSRRTGEE